MRLPPTRTESGSDAISTNVPSTSRKSAQSGLGTGRFGAALPGAPEGYWKLYFRKSKKESPATSGAGEVFLPDFWIENISFDFMDFVLAHEVAHDVLDHLIWGAESREQAEFEADERAIEIMAKADGVDLTKNSMRIVLKLYGRIFPPERVERMKEVLKNLK